MREAMEAACKFLLGEVAEEPVRVNELFDEAERRGITRITLRRAKKELNLRARKTWQVMNGQWMWELPGGRRRPARETSAAEDAPQRESERLQR
jgi:hypothetical protein